LFKNFTAYTGLNLGFLLGSNYNYVEKLIIPATRGTFNNGKRTRNESDSTIPNAKIFHAGINIGIGYGLPLDKKNKWQLEPQIFYSYDFMPLSSGLNWYIHTFRFGLELKRSVSFETPPPPVPPIPPPSPKEPEAPVSEKPSVDIVAIQLDSSNVEKKILNLKIEDYVSLNMRPLLNYIFFDENSAEIPDRYKKISSEEAEKFGINSLHNLDALATYYQLLNLIGKKLKDNPDIKIKLIGTNSNEGDEEHNLILSRQRAEAVENYLVQVWNIPQKQLSVEARNLPDDYSNPKEPGGIQENRRVEIVPSDKSILEPLMTLDTISLPENTKFRFYPIIKIPNGTNKWSLNIKNNGSPVKIIEGSGIMPNYIEWSPAKEDIQNFDKFNELTYRLNIEDSIKNTSQSVQKIIPVEKITLEKKKTEGINGKYIDYYSLILFDFGKTNLLKEHLKILNYIKQKINPDAKVIITGYTDIIGNQDVNRKISEKRAKQAAKILDLPNAEIIGSGKQNLLYDNSLPEGRFYCRTVNITVEIPEENK
jgi:outer membrane protein OmpA-like peptidoglycan-associated protein